MTAAQPTLFDPPPASPDSEVAWLEKLLVGNVGWMTSREIVQCRLRPVNDDNRRWVRELASASEWIISGQKGYLHIQHAKAEEIHHACAWMESQAAKMAKRAGRIRANGHKLFG
jgi:hypothetical protein